MTVTTTTPDYAELVSQGQKAVREATEAYAQVVRDAVAKLPAVPAFPALPEIPDAAATIDTIYDFATKVVETQRDFAKKLFAAAA